MLACKTSNRALSCVIRKKGVLKLRMIKLLILISSGSVLTTGKTITIALYLCPKKYNRSLITKEHCSNSSATILVNALN